VTITINDEAADQLIADSVARGDAARAEARRQARLKPQGPVHRYQPHGTCVELFKYRGDEVLFAGPAGTGKSRACLEKLHAMALANPGFRGLIVRKTLASLGSTALVTFESHVATQHLANNEMKWFGGSPKEAACYRYKNG
jgi:phage terminase large subunit